MINAINTVIGVPLGYLMRWCWLLVGNYGVAIILFTLLTKVILFPLSIWVQNNSIRMIRIKPALNMLEVNMAGDKDRLADAQMALYKEAGYKPLAGLVPTLIQIPIILGLISVVYHPLQHLLHLDASLIGAFTEKAAQLLNDPNLGAGAQMNVMRLVSDPVRAQAFAGLNVPGAAEAVQAIQAMDLRFCGLDLSQTPSLRSLDAYWLLPLFSAASAFLLSFLQNKVNVLQREASFWGQWGMAIFLTLFSLYFAFIVPAGAGLYWIVSNLSAILVMYIVNAMIPPKKYIDYEALEESKEALAVSREAEKLQKPTAEQKKRAKEDYKRFCDEENVKQLVFYSEKSSYYRNFSGLIDAILAQSDIVIHYVTSDPNDVVFQIEDPQIQSYYIDDNRLIPLFMKMDADAVVMTMPDLQQFHLKRSLVRKDVEYIYVFHAMASTNMVVRKGSFDHYDTLLCAGPHQIAETRESEQIYGLPEKKLIEFGYPLLDEMIENYQRLPAVRHETPQVVIAPSHQSGNILETCVEEMVARLLSAGFRVLLRPHPHWISHNPGKAEKIVQRIGGGTNNSSGTLILDIDFKKSESVFNSDLLVTDWSTVAMDFAFATLKPCIFINTEMKVRNPDYVKYKNRPLDITIREQLGEILQPEEVEERIVSIAQKLIRNPMDYKEHIAQIRENTVFNIGNSKQIGARYIIESVNKRRYENARTNG